LLPIFFRSCNLFEQTARDIDGADPTAGFVCRRRMHVDQHGTLILDGLEIARGVSGFDGLATLFNVRLFGGFSLTCINA